MTKREAAIISAYTGILIGKFSDLHEYLEELFGRPIYSHEIPGLIIEMHDKSRSDFLNIQIELNREDNNA